MALGDIAGRARVSLRNPSAMGECDRCGFWYQLDRLQRQFQWAGPALVNTGYLVCKHCLDIPQDQDRTLILPPDPVPRVNPRPSFDVTAIAPATSPQNQGFSAYLLGAPLPSDYPTTKAEVLAQVASLSGVPTPGGIVDHSITITTPNITRSLLASNPARTWMLFYNPAVPQVQISKVTTVWGAITNLSIGPGEAMFWANAQNLAPVYTGAMTGVGLIAPMPFWIWEA